MIRLTLVTVLSVAALSGLPLAPTAWSAERAKPICSDCSKDVLIRPANAQLKPYYLAQTEVTWAQYLRAVKEAGCPVPENRLNRPIPNVAALADDYAVTGITYAGVECYIHWLNRSTGLTYRLPTAAEWLYVAKRAYATLGDKRLGVIERSPSDRETRDAVRGGVILPAHHGALSPDGLYGLLDSAGEYTAETVPLPSDKCKIYGVKICHKRSVYGSWMGFTKTPFLELGYFVDIDTNTDIGFRLARTAQ